MPTNYDRTIPDAPIAPSMLPSAVNVTDDDILVLTQPRNQIGRKNKSLTLGKLKEFISNTGFSVLNFFSSGNRSFKVSGAGTEYSREQQSGDTYKILENDDGIKLQLVGANVNWTACIQSDEISINKAVQSLSNKLTLNTDGITIAHETRNGNDTQTTSTVITEESVATTILKLGVPEIPEMFSLHVDWNPSSSTHGYLYLSGTTQHVCLGKIHSNSIDSFGSINAQGNINSIGGEVRANTNLKGLYCLSNNTPKEMTSIGNPDAYGNYFDFQLSSQWVNKQQKLIYNPTASDITQAVYLASDMDGTSHSLINLTFPARRFLRLIYSGHDVTQGENTFGVFFVGT